MKPFEEFDNVVNYWRQDRCIAAEKNRIWFGGGHMDWLRFRGDHENYKFIDDFSDNIREITFATGCCMLIKNEIIENIRFIARRILSCILERVDYCLESAREYII